MSYLFGCDADGRYPPNQQELYPSTLSDSDEEEGI